MENDYYEVQQVPSGILKGVIFKVTSGSDAVSFSFFNVLSNYLVLLNFCYRMEWHKNNTSCHAFTYLQKTVLLEIL